MFQNILFPNNYIPHGHCYMWQPGLLGLHIISDSLIFLAYYSIPLTLLYFLRKRKDVPFRMVIALLFLLIQCKFLSYYKT